MATRNKIHLAVDLDKDPPLCRTQIWQTIDDAAYALERIRMQSVDEEIYCSRCLARAKLTAITQAESETNGLVRPQGTSHV